MHVFSSSLAAATQRFVEQLKAHRWSARTTVTPVLLPAAARPDSLAPPLELLEFPFLAMLTNAVLAAFNELRQCAPLSLQPSLKQQLEDAVATVVSAVRWLKAEARFSTPAEEASFARMCRLLVEQQMPHLSRCFDAVFHSAKPLINLSALALLTEYFVAAGPPTPAPATAPVLTQAPTSVPAPTTLPPPAAALDIS